MIGLIVLIVLVGVIVILIDKVDQKNKQIKQMERKKHWDDFSYQLLETQLLVRDAIDQCREMRSNNGDSVAACDKFLKYTNDKGESI